MLAFDLATEVVNDEGELGWAVLVVPESGCDLAGVVAVLGQSGS